MLKIGVLGAGHIGKIHINCIKQLPVYELIGFYDQDNSTAKKVADGLEETILHYLDLTGKNFQYKA